MIKFKEIKGLTLENTENLQKIVRTEDGKAIGHIPGWKCFTDAGYADGVLVRNRAIANNQALASKTVVKIKEGDNQLFDLSDALRVDYGEKMAINPDEYTFFAVINTNGGVSELPYWVFRGNTSSTDSIVVENLPNFCASPSGGQVSVMKKITDKIYNDAVGAGERLVTFSLNRNVKTTTGLSLIILSFSVENGFTCSQDGDVIGNVAHSIALQNDLNNVSSFRNMRGRAGALGIFDIDLHKPENTAYRKQLEAHLMKKYAIA
ncbi:hypothetical protein HLH12_09215 [Acinetobacter sp. NIPH 2377]|uniref:hypothetical protein n=1 Tax=Acinetobacter terrestris TaxID=2529843 RepID=UPI00148F9F6E|nr:hypothetical protein [Acinetobacter terrestris]NNH35722.1 hypothetical protein [Acinetobacter terrestris]